jgi:hypothetical protein
MTEKTCRKYEVRRYRCTGQSEIFHQGKEGWQIGPEKDLVMGQNNSRLKKGYQNQNQYNDGTSEVAKFPDDDVVVDAVMNGEHAKPANRFLPPSSDNKLMEVETGTPQDDEVDVDVLRNSLPSHTGNNWTPRLLK